MALMFREEPKRFNLAYRLYAVAFVLLLFWALWPVIFGKRFWLVGGFAYYLSVALFVAGFVTWIVPKLQPWGRSRLGRFGLVGTHLTILLVAIPHRKAVHCQGNRIAATGFGLHCLSRRI